MKQAVRLSVLVVLTLLPLAAQDVPDDVRKAADNWLALLDTGKFGESWDRASKSFKDAVEKIKWEEQAREVRAPLGKIESRKLSGSQALKDPPNSPPGDYQVLQYASRFEKNEDVTETVVLILESDGQWRVAGYFVK